MSDDDRIDEDLHLARQRLREVLSALAVLTGGEAVAEPLRPAALRLVEEAELPGDLHALARAAAHEGVAVAAVPAEPPLEREPARRLALRLHLLALRLGGAEAAARAEALAPAHEPEAIEALVSRLGARPELDAEAALLEFSRPPAFLRALLAARREAEDTRRHVGLISPSRYRHPLDVAASEGLTRTLPYDDLARTVSEVLPERAFRLVNTASNLRVGPDQLPDLYRLYQGCVRRLGVTPEPPLYVARGGFNAYTAGVERPFVVLHDTLVSLCSERELEFVIGHELGHIQFDHVLTMMVARVLTLPGALLASVPVLGPLLARGAAMALFEWSRKAELSCDRAGLLCCQDPGAAWRLMLRMAGGPSSMASQLDVEAFLRQHEELEAEWDDQLSAVIYLMSTLERSHPWPIVRARELSRWIEEGEYDRMLAACAPEGPAAPRDPRSVLASAGLRAPSDPRAGLAWLAGRVRSAGMPELVGRALDEAATAAPTPPRVLVVGARFRRREALVEALAAGAPGVEILEAPDLDESPEAFQAVAVPALLGGAPMVVALSAAQLLSRVEREVLGALLAAHRGPVALAVGRMDAVETPEDARDLSQRVAAFAGGRAAVILSPVEGPPVELLAWVSEALAGGAAAGDVHARARAMARAVRDLCGDAAPSPVDLAEPLRRLRRRVTEEHRTQLDAARAGLALGFARLRAEAPDQLAALSGEARRHEGVAMFTAEVAALGEAAGRGWVDGMRSALLDQGALPLAEAVGAVDGGLGLTEAGLDLPRRGKPSGRVIAAALGSLGLGALLVPGAPLWAALSGVGLGTASLFAGHHAREHRDEALLREQQAALLAWLDRCEAELTERLTALAEGGCEALLGRLADLDGGAAMLAPDAGRRAARLAAVELLAALGEGGEE